jgi:hypothetical protein
MTECRKCGGQPGLHAPWCGDYLLYGYAVVMYAEGEVLSRELFLCADYDDDGLAGQERQAFRAAMLYKSEQSTGGAFGTIYKVVLE